ncbi:hypothetical protein LOK49_LG09G00555, partial [Camellia lanceoleosa]
GQYGTESSGGNGKQHEQVQAVVALRSGRKLEPQSVASDATRVRKGDHGGSPNENKGEGETIKRDDLVPSTSLEPKAPYVPKAPFPQCLDTPSPFNKKAASIEAMMEVFKQVKINLPLLEAIKQVPSYAKFLKDLCTQKRKSRTHVSQKVLLTEQ